MQARQLGKEPSKDMFIRDGWYHLVRNVTKDLMPAANLFMPLCHPLADRDHIPLLETIGQLVSALARKSNPTVETARHYWKLCFPA
jgi:hypothetical protein